MAETKRAARARAAQTYALMNAGMDHALAQLLPADCALVSSLALPTAHAAAMDSWRALTDVFEARRAKLKEKEDKRRLKEEARRQKLKKQQQQQQKTGEDRKKGESEPRKNGKAKTAQPGSRDKPKQKKAVKRDVKAVGKTLASPRSSPVASANSFLSPDTTLLVLAKLRELDGLGQLSMGTIKYKALVRWLEVDQAKNLPAPRELLKFVARLRAREEKRANKNNASLKLAKAREETLDDRLRAERKKKILEASQPRSSASQPRSSASQPRSSASRKRRVVDDSDEEQKDVGSDEEPEYADGYSDSPEDGMSDGEAEFEPSVPTRSSDGSSQLPKTSGTEQLQRVVAKIKEEDLMAKASDSQYLSYEKKSKKPGSSPKNAIILDSDEEEEEEEDSDSVDVETEKHEESEGGEDNDAADESSTDEENGMFDLNEEDVYIVESILMVKEGRTLFTNNGKRRSKEADLYLVKWDGYDELTWEPESNIPHRLVEFFRDRERAKRSCHYQIVKFMERRVVDNVTTNKKEVIYLIQWLGQEQAVWEVRASLPEKTLIWLDKVAGVSGDQTKKRLKIYSSGAR